MHNDLKQRAVAHGRATFGDAWPVDGWTIAPGRVELIGNHIDYNGGPVLAAAIQRVMVVGTGPVEKPGEISLLTPDVSGEVASFGPLTLGDWHATDADTGPVVYVKGACVALMNRRIPIRTGVGLATTGNIPPGFGMSSSAAFCVATILALTIDEIEPQELVAIAREAEHRAGSPVGAMDQSASVAGHVIVFDGKDNSFRTITPDLGDLVFAVAHSGVDRSLRTSSYGARVNEADQARSTLGAAYGFDLPTLADFEPHWDEAESTLEKYLSPTLIKRVRHVVSETRRVKEAEAALRNNEWERFGELMNESGDSSANDYEISHPVVEELVTHLREQDGVLGARMMGGGEGGPALVLLHRDAVEDIRASLDATFYRDHPARSHNPIQICTFGSGARRESA